MEAADYMFLETSRLIVRNFTKDDIVSAHKYLGDTEVMKYIEPAFTYQETEKFILDYGIQTNPVVYALVENASSKVIGHIIFHTFKASKSDGIYELGWIMGRNYWGKGYGLEISKAIIQYAFKELNADKIIAETVEENPSSLALIKKLGMKQEESIQDSQDLLIFGLKNYFRNDS
jgi:RimJ/RimL family protein N-acetyltransferase